QACDKTKDKTKELLKRWRTLPEGESASGHPEDICHATWVNRCSEDLECLDLDEEQPLAQLSSVQTEKMTLFFTELLDHDRDDVIKAGSFCRLVSKHIRISYTNGGGLKSRTTAVCADQMLVKSRAELPWKDGLRDGRYFWPTSTDSRICRSICKWLPHLGLRGLRTLLHQLAHGQEPQRTRAVGSGPTQVPPTAAPISYRLQRAQH
ncbi:unnamed protein product, partial [Leptidea sinapis]